MDLTLVDGTLASEAAREGMVDEVDAGAAKATDGPGKPAATLEEAEKSGMEGREAAGGSDAKFTPEVTRVAGPAREKDI